MRKPKYKPPPERARPKPTEEQLKVRRWFMALGRQRACDLLIQSRDYSPDFREAFFREQYRASLETAQAARDAAAEES